MKSWFRAHRAAPLTALLVTPRYYIVDYGGVGRRPHLPGILSLGSLSMASVVSEEVSAFTLTHDYSMDGVVEEIDENIQVAGIEWSEDAIIEVGMSLDARSEEVLEKVRRAAARLRDEYGVSVIVVPRMEYWGYGQFTIGFSDYPRVRVNGFLLSAGDITEEDVIDAVLAMLGMEAESDAAPDSMAPHARPHENPVLNAAAVSA